MRHTFFILFLASAAQAAGVAPPKPVAETPTGDPATDDAKKLYRQAELEYKLGRFDDALRLFSKAYETKPIPGFLFNIGQCHFNLKNWERAVFFYQGYLRDLPNAPNRAAADSQLAIAWHEFQKQQRLARKNKTDAPADTATPAPIPPKQIVAAPSAPEPATAPASAPAPAPEVEASTPVYKKWWLWTIVGVVVAGGAATAVALVLTQPTKTAPAPPTVDWRTR